jgi:hypothetical protein
MAKTPPTVQGSPIPAPHHRQTVKHRTAKGKFKSPPAMPRSRQPRQSTDQSGSGGPRDPNESGISGRGDGGGDCDQSNDIGDQDGQN